MRAIQGLLLSLWLSLNAMAQNPAATLTGRVVDANTQAPLPFSTVYLNNSTRGTTADEKGVYRLTNVPLGTVELVGSAVGYKAARQPLRLTDTRPRTVDLSLQPSDNALSAVTVTARRNRSWVRQFRTFSRELLGSRPMARECRITNENVLSFSEEKGRLVAQANEPLVIENGALGYRLFYNLLYFDVYRGKMHFAGTVRFEEMPTTDARQRIRWQTNRMKAYKGSLRHLLANLLAGSQEQEGYLVYRTPLVADNGQVDLPMPIVRTANRQYISGPQAAALFRPGELAFERRLVSDDPIEVYYDRVHARNSPYGDSPAAYSLLMLPNKTFDLTTTGWITQPKGLDVRGFLGDDRLATLLPADWVPTDKQTLLASDIKAGRIIRTDVHPDSLAAERRRQRDRTPPIVFVHTDKSFYVTGDHVWLSAYVLDPVTHLPVLGVDRTALHVELIAPGGQSIQHQWLSLSNGRVGGEFRLADTLASGTYRLRAYTDADPLADGPGFECGLLVHNSREMDFSTESRPGQTHPATRPNAPASPGTNPLDVQFLPEGGRWLMGVSSRLGIKALKPDGHGVAVRGRIVDEAGTEAAQFTTSLLGMGHVLLTPQPGHTYTALVEQAPSGRPQWVSLPPAQAEGWALSVDATSDSTRIWVRIRATGRYAEQSATIALQNQGQMVYRETWQLHKGEAEFALPVSGLLAGVSRLTVSDATGRAQAERLVFVPERSAPVQMRVVAGKSQYAPRETMAIGLQLRDADNYPVVATWSAAVTDADQLPLDTTTTGLRAYLLLTGGLRGPIESPSYYLDEGHVGDIDDLLLTQGWRRLLNPTPADSTGGWTLSGQVRDEQGRPLWQKKVLLSLEQGDQRMVRGVQTDKQGGFRLDGLLIRDTVRVHAVVPGLPDAVITFNAPGHGFATPALPNPDWQPLAGFMTKARIRQAADPAFYRDSTARQLAEVTVRAIKVNRERPEEVKRMSMHGEPDAAINIDENGPLFANVFEMMIGRLPGVQIYYKDGGYVVTVRGPSSLGNSGPLYLLDGMYTDQEVLLNIDPRTVSRIELLKNAGSAAIYGSRAAGGVIAVYTRQGHYDPVKMNKQTIATISGFASTREFYVPRYGSSETATGTDRRDVLFWNPLGQTDSDGLARLLFPLNDKAKAVRIVLQGLTNEGAPISFSWVLPVR